MNKHLHRLIFNRARGQRMAVQETAGSAGKSGSGETRGSSGGSSPCGPDARPSLLRLALWATVGALAGVQPVAQAQLIAAPSAPAGQRPVILNTANGLPLVNIQTPSAGGVSRNTFSRFDVQPGGAVLNNSRTDVQSQLGGFVQGNPYLATGSARIILNEVNSGNPSLLRGYTEVAGPRADVIIANPAGIHIDGAGFINTRRVTLTTGTPLVNGASLDAWRVQRGTVSLGGAGLDNRAVDYTAILARAIEVNAGIWANELKAVAGANDIDAAHSHITPITPIAGSGPAPAFALDSAQLGGMYAGKIWLVGTEAGVGVRNAGFIGAAAGELVLQANGWLANSGTLQGQADIELQASGIANSGHIAAARTLAMATPGALDNTGGSLTAQRLDIRAASLGNRGGTIATAGELRLQTGRLDNRQGAITAGASLKASALQLDNTAGLIAANGAVQLDAAALDNTGGTIASVKDALGIATAGALANDAGLIQAAGELAIDTGGQRLSNTRAANYPGTGPADAARGGITSQGALSLATGDIDNTQGFIGAAGAFTARAAQVANTGGLMAGQSTLAITAAGFANQAGQVQALGDITLDTGTGALDNASGLVRGAAGVALHAGALGNRNTPGADQGIEGSTLQLTAASIDNHGGALRADQDITLASAGGLDNRAGLISAGRALQTAAHAFTNTGGTAIAGQSHRIAARSATGDGRLLSHGDLSLSVNSGFSNTGALIASGNASIAATGQLTNSGQLQAGQTLAIAARDIDNTATGEISAAATRITATGTLTNRGLIDGQDTQVDADTLNNLGTGRIYGNRIGIAARTLRNDAETVGGLGGMADITTAATIAARERLDIGADTLDNSGGALIFSGGGMAIGGQLDGARRASGQARLIRNAGASLESLGAMALTAERLQNANPGFSYQLSDIAPVTRTDYVARDGTAYASDQFAWDSTSLLAIQAFRPPHASGIEGSIIIGAQALDSPYAAPLYKAYYDGPDAFTAWHMGSTGSGDGTTAFYVPDMLAYEQDDPVWAVFGLPRPATPNPGPHPVAHYTHPNDTGVWVEPGAEELAAWETAAAPWKALQARLDAFRTVVDAHMSVFPIYRRYTETGQQASVTAGSPGQILSGGDMTLHASAELLNDNSRIIAGGTLAATGVPIDNRATQITASLSRNGQTTRFGLTGTSCDALGCDDHYGYITDPYAVTIPQTLTTGIAVAQGNAPAVPTTGVTAPPAAIADAGASPAAAGAVSAAARNAGIVQVLAVSGSGAGPAPVVRSVQPDTRLPTAGLFRTSPTAGYLIETDPRFANYKNWLGSDYLLSALGLDPARMQKRLGDGFYEQRLVREQALQLTGQRFLGDYSDDDSQYRALMDAGITVARQQNLRPGVALSAAQMAQLTSDIVWLVAQDVSLADGSVQQVLVPRLYVRVRQGDIDGAGTLLAGRSVDLRLTGESTNTGTIAGRGIVHITGRNLHNLGGRISGADVSVEAAHDLNNIGGTIDASRSLYLHAGNDLNVASTTASGSGQAGTTRSSYSGIDRVAGLYVTGPGGVLAASSGQDIHLTGAVIQSQGSARLAAGRDLDLASLSQSDGVDASRDSANYLRWSQRRDIGSQVGAQGDIALTAGRDLTAIAASVNSQDGELFAHAGRNVNIAAGQSETSLATSSRAEDSGLLKSGSTEVRSSAAASRSLGSSWGGNTVFIGADNDIQVTGSSVVSDKGTTLVARHDLTIQSATDTHSQGRYSAHRESGLTLDGGVFIGSQAQSLEQQDRRSSAAASTVGSTGGNVILRAGNAYTQTGSDVLAPNGDAEIQGKTVRIAEARETARSQRAQAFRQSGLTVAVSNPVMSAAQGMTEVAGAMNDTADGRMRALGAASIALGGYNTVASLSNKTGQLDPQKAGAVDISLSLGTSQGESRSSSQDDTARGSSVRGRNISITATGAGEGSDLLIQGSEVHASHKTTLKAGGKVIMRAAGNTASQSSSNSASSASMGMSAGTSGGFALNASASKSSGKSDGSDTWHTNTHVSGREVEINSGGDTVMDGAVVTAHHVTGAIGGNLVMGSRQDTSSHTSAHKSAGGSISVSAAGVPIGGGVSLGQSHIDSRYASVGETTGIKTGDGGFDIHVQGKTILNGAVITTTGKAVDEKRNQFESKGGIETSDIENRADYKGDGYALSASAGTGQGPDGKTLYRPGGSLGVASVGDSASSTTRSGISGIAGDPSVRTGDAGTGIAKIFEPATTQKEIDARVSITAAFGKEASRTVGDYAKTQIDKAKALRTEATQEPDSHRAAALNAQAQELDNQWGDNGTTRLALHTVIGSLTGGLDGASGSLIGTLTAPEVARALNGAGIDGPVAQAIVALASTGAGVAAGGASGGAAAFNEVTNNYLNHAQWQHLSDKLAACKSEAECRQVKKEAEELSARQDSQMRQACQDTGNAACRIHIADALAGSNMQMALVSTGRLPDNYVAGSDLNAQANRWARNVVASDIKAACLADAVCRQKQDSANGALLLGTLGVITAPLLPSLGSATVAWIVANPVMALQLGIITAETAAALSSGAVSPGSLAEGMFAVAATSSVKFAGAGSGARNLIGGATIKTLAEAADTPIARSAAQAQKLQQELQAFSKVEPDTARDAYYLANTDQSMLKANNFDMNHVLSGEINAGGKATGYHAELAAEGAARIRPGSQVTQNGNGTYTAQVDVWDPNRLNPRTGVMGDWVEKVSNKGESTFFNPSWSEARIEYEVAEAFKGRKMLTDTKWRGMTPSGVEIDGYTKSSRTTFYPTGK